MHFYTPPQPAQRIPVIDLEGTDEPGPDREQAAWGIHRACRETGFFYIANHGVPRSLIDAQFELARRFFDLPLIDKEALSLRKNPAAVGYAPIGGQRLDSQDATKDAAPPDLKESFFWGTDVAPDHPYALAGYRGFGSNHAPAIEGFREQMNAYAAAMRRTGDLLLSLIARSIGLNDDWFSSFFQSEMCNLRMIKYPPQRVDAQFNQIGAGAHTDWGALTLLAQDDIGGLEVRNVAGDWLAAPPIADTFVVNLGDLMMRWTNGLYTSNLHRVRNNATDRNRYSVPFFYNADPTAVIEAIPTCVTHEHPRKYPACTANEHSAEMFRRSYGYRHSDARQAA